MSASAGLEGVERLMPPVAARDREHRQEQQRARATSDGQLGQRRLLLGGELGRVGGDERVLLARWRRPAAARAPRRVSSRPCPVGQESR